jgi:hypothetical protein
VVKATKGGGSMTVELAMAGGGGEEGDTAAALVFHWSSTTAVGRWLATGVDNEEGTVEDNGEGDANGGGARDAGRTGG